MFSMRMKTHKSIVLKFFIRDCGNPLYVGLTHVSLVSYLLSDISQKIQQQKYIYFKYIILILYH